MLPWPAVSEQAFNDGKGDAERGHAGGEGPPDVVERPASDAGDAVEFFLSLVWEADELSSAFEERGSELAEGNDMGAVVLHQGNRVKGLCGEEAFEEVVVPSCGFSFEAQ